MVVSGLQDVGYRSVQQTAYLSLWSSDNDAYKRFIEYDRKRSQEHVMSRAVYGLHTRSLAIQTRLHHGSQLGRLTVSKICRRRDSYRRLLQDLELPQREDATKRVPDNDRRWTGGGSIGEEGPFMA